MTPEQRLLKAIELSELAKEQALQELRTQHPQCSDAEIIQLYILQREDDSEQRALIAGLFSQQRAE